jgi:nucleoside recognition membrane protein YjiH
MDPKKSIHGTLPTDSDESNNKTISTSRVLKSLLPSLLGILLFMLPIESGGRVTVPIAILIDVINESIASFMLIVSVVIAVIPSIITLFVSAIPALRNQENRFVQLFNPGLLWTTVRLLGAGTMLLVYFKVGPEWIWSPYTGGILLYEVAPVLLALYLVSALLLPLLTNYGLMEFVGVIFGKAFSRMFNLPGRAAIDSLASWMSATSLGIILTTQQYKEGHYTKREAAAIVTSFSIVSVAFSYAVLKFIKMEHAFISWYFSVSIAGIVCALIVPRLPPLRNISNEYSQSTQTTDSVLTQGTQESLWAFALRRAVERSDNAESIKKQFLNGIHVASDMAITVYPAMMIVGVLGLSLIEYTSVMQTIAIPLVPILELLQLPEAQIAAVAIMTGFIDLLMPVILGAKIESELTRFVIAGVTVNGIIFLSEVALIMMRAKIGLNLWRLAIIWILRLLISLPIMTLMGHLIL